MSQVVLLSDLNSYGELGSSRYIGPYVLATQLEASGFSTVVIDYFTKKDNFFDYLKNFLSNDTLIVGISTTFLNPLKSYFSSGRNRFEGTVGYRKSFLWFEDPELWLTWSKELKDTVRSVAPNAKIIIGGAKAVNFLSDPLMATHIDYFALAAGDKTIVDCALKLEQGLNPDFNVISSGLKILNNITLKNQMDVCPTTYYKKNLAIQPKESLSLEISRGCIFNCKFCYYEKKNSVRKTVDNLITEIKSAYDQNGTTVFSFSDDCFNDSREKVETICNAIIQLPFKIEWVSYARIDVASKFPHTLELMVESGATSLFWGIESLNHEAARRAGKGTPPENVMKLLIDFKKRHGDKCFSFGSFITGLPGENEDSFLKNLNWVLEEDCLHATVFGPLTLSPYNEKLDMTLIDYSDYSRNPQKYGFKSISDDLSDWEHETMNFSTANRLADYANHMWLSKKGAGLYSFAWQYPHFRSLGYSKHDLFTIFASNEHKFALAQEVADKNRVFLNKYWEDLARLN